MFKQFRSTALSAAVFAVSLAAGAQPAAPTVPAAPAEASGYQSAFEGYRPFSAQDVGDWRQANETVREIGGWRAYAREIQAGAAAPQPASQTPAQGTNAPARGPGQPPAPAAASRPGAPAPSGAPVRPADPHRGQH